MSLKARLRKAAFNRHILLGKLETRPNLTNFIDRFRPNYKPCNLVRIGSGADGGYLLPDALDGLAYCFSPGVADSADFENELSKRGIRSFMADASVSKAPIDNDLFHFIPKFLGARSHNEYITLSDWIEQSIGDDNSPKVLQMDIEGAEYDVLGYESAETLAGFSILTIEFHDLNKLFEKDFLRLVSIIFEKLFKNFVICHVHPNNCCGLTELDGIAVPRVMEVTFVRHDILPKVLRQDPVQLPHPLDVKNVPHLPKILMPEIWWKE